MSNRLRRGLWVGTLLLALGIIVIAVLAFVVVPRPAVQEWLGGKLSQAAGPAVDFDAVSLVFWPEPAILLHAVKLGSEEQAAATVGSVSCTLAVSALLRGDVVIDEVTVVRPVTSVTRDAEGRWSLGGGLGGLAGGGSGDTPEAAPVRPSLPRRLAIRDGEIDLLDRRVEGGPVTLHLRNFDAELTLPGEAERGDLRLSLDGPDSSHLEVTATLEPVAAGAPLGATAFAAEVRGVSLGSDSALLYLLFGLPIRNAGGVFDIAGTVSGRFTGAIEGKARIDLSEGAVEGWGIRMGTPMSLAAGFDVVERKFSMRGVHLEAASSGFAGFAGDRTVADFEWVESTLNVAELDVAAYGGSWNASGSVDFEGTPSYTAEISAAGVSFRELSAAMQSQPVSEGFESFDGEATVSGTWPGPDDWQRNLSGSGSLRLAGGQLESSTVLRSVFKAMFGRVPGLGRMARDEKPTALESVTATFSLAKGRAQTEDLVVVTSDYRMEGGGSVGLDGQLQLAARVALTARGIKQVYVYAAMPFRKSGNKALPAIPVHLSGSLAAPEVRPDLTGISLSPFRALFGGAESAFGRIIDVATPKRNAATPDSSSMEE